MFCLLIMLQNPRFRQKAHLTNNHIFFVLFRLQFVNDLSVPIRKKTTATPNYFCCLELLRKNPLEPLYTCLYLNGFMQLKLSQESQEGTVSCETAK